MLTLCLFFSGKRAVVGYSDGTMRVFDLKTSSVLHNVTGRSAHVAPVSSLAVRSDSNLIASGGVDGKSKLFHVQSGKTIGTFTCISGKSSGASAASTSAETPDVEGDPTEQGVDSNSTVEAVIFTKPETNYLITGSLEGVLNIWDLSTQVIIAFSRKQLSQSQVILKNLE